MDNNPVDTRPRVSVIIPAYNVEAYIERAIQSVLDQQNATVEVIVVNDASTDGTAAAITRIRDARVGTITLPANLGPGGARNAGIAAATLPWISVLDGDDAFLPDRLARCLMRAKIIDADVVVDNLQVIREADKAEYPMFDPLPFSRLGTLTLAKFISGNRSFLGGAPTFGYLKPIFSAAFLRRHALVYDTELRIGEDYLLMCEVLAKGALCAVEPTAGYNYTVRATSISHRLTPADVERIAAGDRKWLAHNKLDFAAAKAQKQRQHGIREALAFTRLVEAIKARNTKAALQALALWPPAVLQLWRPVWVRVRRVFGRVRK